MGVSACHRVFIGFAGSNTRVDIYLRIVCHLTLVHAVESQFLAVGAPEGTGRNTEFISVYGRTVHHTGRAVGGQLVLLVIGIPHVQLVVFHVGYSPRCLVPVGCCLALATLCPYRLLGFPVV